MAKKTGCFIFVLKKKLVLRNKNNQLSGTNQSAHSQVA